MVWPSFSAARGVSVPVTTMVSSFGPDWARAGAPTSARLAAIARREEFRCSFTLTSPMLETVHPRRRHRRTDARSRTSPGGITSVRSAHPRTARKRLRQAGLLTCGSTPLRIAFPDRLR